MSSDLDLAVRLAAFDFLTEQIDRHGEVLPARTLNEGFDFNGQQVRLKGQQGIFKPKILPYLPLSITTAPPSPGRDRPYDDGFSKDGSTLHYKYRGTDPAFHENTRLRAMIEARRPLVYFHGVVRAEYFVAFPIFVVGDDPAQHIFRVAVDDARFATSSLPAVHESGADARREYVTVTTRQRLHQRSFRTRVLQAYRHRCSLCRLKHTELLDAAHILPDSDPRGEPIVPNGLALCKLHHAAFDHGLIGIHPDLRAVVRPDILNEKDGPMLLHGLQGLHSQPLLVPRCSELRPRRAFLEERFREFEEWGAA